jgi:hypothetical protein
MGIPIPCSKSDRIVQIISWISKEWYDQNHIREIAGSPWAVSTLTGSKALLR